MITQDSVCRQTYFDEAMVLHDTLHTWVPRLLSDNETSHAEAAEFRFWTSQINNEFRILHERMRWALSVGQTVERSDLECLRDIARRVTNLSRLTEPSQNGAT
ncbi:hypothetical protein Rumeso_03105 [Rubellimicrobium mesophilum DSM 19309]|uniref:Uncharacterized protein n=1 Tax=Rubellimicrobium mesophilum DSM 19309 TaxID=442562 RepID=A0A017HMC1_9RHOB|nr:hypothetical protein [Rubellimicrobium mesophilum]EYD75318.1 hypothetical protein Rumeso_03105 [Rubellimicrobium mesophilum DSM 19309]